VAVALDIYMHPLQAIKVVNYVSTTYYAEALPPVVCHTSAHAITLTRHWILLVKS